MLPKYLIGMACVMFSAVGIASTVPQANGEVEDNLGDNAYEDAIDWYHWVEIWKNRRFGLRTYFIADEIWRIRGWTPLLIESPVYFGFGYGGDAARGKSIEGIVLRCLGRFDPNALHISWDWGWRSQMKVTGTTEIQVSETIGVRTITDTDAAEDYTIYDGAQTQTYIDLFCRDDFVVDEAKSLGQIHDAPLALTPTIQLDDAPLLRAIPFVVPEPGAPMEYPEYTLPLPVLRVSE